jgi:ABC-type multidrug transport system fused ATPase/permease subunit
MNRFSQNVNIRFLGSLLTCMGISLAISVAILFIVPFPWSLVAVIGIFLLLDFYLMRNASRRMRNEYSDNSAFDSLSSLFTSSDSGGRMSNKGS